jgi:Ca-activated chloride channel homolog
MKKSHQIVRLFDFWRGTLPTPECEELQKELGSSEVLNQQLDENKELFEGLRSLAAHNHAADSQFSTDTMRKIRQSIPDVEGNMKSIIIELGTWIVRLGYLILFILIAATLYFYLSGNKLALSSSAANKVLMYLEGTIGALLIVASVALAIVLSTLGKYRSGAACLMLALVCFVNRSLTSTFFNYYYISNDGYVASPLNNKSGRTIQYNDMRVAEAGPAIGQYLGLQAPKQQYAAKEELAVKKGRKIEMPTDIYAAGAPLAEISYSDNYQQIAESREQYGQYEENPRFDPQSTPLSTFSIDVDTGSYTNMRRFITAGQLPPKDSVRVEEYINYFDYDYNSSTTEPFAVNLEVAPSPLDPNYHLLRVGIKARTMPLDNERGWNLVFLVDVSGSMSDSNKLPLVKESLKLLAKKMRPVDRIALVTYAGNAGLVLDSTPGSETARIISAIDSLGAGGSTNGSGGIELAYQVAARSKIPQSVNRVILATDGDFNVGISSFDALMQLIEEKRKTGITLTTLGFGQGNIQEKSMEQLANRGNGNYYYIDSFREARKVLDTGLTSTMEVVAKDVKLQMEFNPAVVKQYRLIGFDNRKLNKEDFTNDAKDAGEIGSGHTVTALYELVLQNSPLAKKIEPELRYQKTDEATPSVPANAEELGFLKIRYKEPEQDISKPLSFAVANNIVKNQSQEASADFKFATSVAYFGQLLRESQYKGSYGFAEVLKLAKENKGPDANGNRAEFIKLVEDAQALKR